MTLTGCDYKSMELDCLLLQIVWETLSECCFGAKADGMAALLFLVPAEGRFKLRIPLPFPTRTDRVLVQYSKNSCVRIYIFLKSVRKVLVFWGSLSGKLR